MAKNFVGVALNVDTRQLDTLEQKIKNQAQDRAMDKSLTWLTKRMKDYPPVRPSSSYTRTFNHRRGVVRLKRSKRSASVIFTDRYSAKGKKYAMWVRDTKRQAGVHRGRWPTSDDIAKESHQKIKGFYEFELRKVAR